MDIMEIEKEILEPEINTLERSGDGGILVTGKCKRLKLDVENFQLLPTLEKMDTAEVKVEGSESPASENDSAIKEVIQLFWSLTGRKKVLNETILTPESLHKWGKFNDVKENSTTLNLLLANGIGVVRNFKETLNKILTELEYKYRIEPFITFKNKNKFLPPQKAVTIDVETIPRMSFYGLADTEQEAIEIAARRGIEYFIDLS